jgi:hypothetical protein
LILFIAALIFAGNINNRKAITKRAVAFWYLGNNKQMAKAISIIPVAYIMKVLAGKTSGIISDIPLVNTKCPIAVNRSMNEKAILPEI